MVMPHEIKAELIHGEGKMILTLGKMGARRTRPRRDDPLPHGLVQSSFKIQTSERGLPLLSGPTCSSQSEVKSQKRPSIEMLPPGWVLK